MYSTSITLRLQCTMISALSSRLLLRLKDAFASSIDGEDVDDGQGILLKPIIFGNVLVSDLGSTTQLRDRRRRKEPVGIGIDMFILDG